MTLTSHRLAGGPGWRIDEQVCTAGPHDRPFEEQHDAACIAVVTRGAFRYRSSLGVALLAPGAILLGNAGQCYECGHEHQRGDRCLSFHFAPEYLETIVACVAGARQAHFGVPRLPPLAALMPLVAEAEAAHDWGDGAELEEVALRLADAVFAALNGADRSSVRPPSRRDEQRVAAALHRIEVAPQERLTLTDLAREASTSPFHFLRIFRRVVGMTPHRFVMRTRLHHAAVQLRRSDARVTAIAFDAGFDDLSTFNRHFRRAMGSSPSAYRRR
ncbi:MAG: helix-turn-helix transcriptional regulator [Burkholderiaceae bacterium]